MPELRKLAETAFGGWPRGTATPAKLRRQRPSPPRLVIVDRPGSPQTQLRVATIGVPRSSPDYVPVRVMNTILGGMFASRINMNLREAHGYTYGANSQFSFWRNGGPFAVNTGVRTDVTAPAVHEVMIELKTDDRDAGDARGVDAREGLHYAVASRPASKRTTAPWQPLDACSPTACR